MKDISAVLFLLAIFISLNLMAQGANPIPNASLELVDENGWAVGWIRELGANENIVEISRKHAKDGRRSLHLVCLNGPYADAFSPRFPIKPSTKYILQFYCHGGGNVFTFFYDSGGKEIEKERKYYGFSGRKFSQNTVSFTSPQDASSMALLFRVYPPNGEAWIDDLSLLEQDGKEYLEVPNPSFEIVLPDGLPWGWRFEPQGGKNLAEITDKVSAFGKRALHLKCSAPPYCDAISASFPVKGGITYTLSFSAIAPQNTGVFVFIFNDKGEEIGAVEADAGRHFFFQTKGQGFERVKIKFTPKAGATSMFLYFRTYVGGELFVDGIQIETGEATDFAKEEKPFVKILLNWHAFAKREKIPIRALLYNPSNEAITGKLVLTLKDEYDEVVDVLEKNESVYAGELREVKAELSTDKLSLGSYKINLSFASLPSVEERIYIVPRLEKETIGFGFYGYVLTGERIRRYGDADISSSLDLLASANMNLMSVWLPNEREKWLDEMAKRGIGFAGIEGAPVSAPDEATQQDYSLTSEGKVQTCYWSPDTGKPRLSYISPLARELARSELGNSFLKIKEHPAFSGKIFFGDDFFMWRGTSWEDMRCGPLSDYSYHAVKIFKEKTGIEAPRFSPEDLRKVTGIIPDNDPWLLWNRFRCKDIFADYMKVVCDTYKSKLGADTHHVFETWWNPGFGICPSYEQKVLTLPGYYSYPASPYMHLFGVEAVRLGADDKDIYIIPSAHNNLWGKWFEERSPEYERAVFHSILAGGGKGVLYCPFQPLWEFDEGHKAVWQEFRRQGEFLQKYGKLLYALRRKKEPVGLLISFSSDVYRILERPNEHCFRVAGTFFSLLRAQIPVELVDEERVASGDLSHYKVIYLSDVTVLPQSVAKALESFISKGGIVLMDDLCKVEIKGAKKLPFNASVIPIDEDDSKEGAYKTYNCPIEPYSQARVKEAVEKIKQTFKGIIEEVVQTDSLDIACRRFVDDKGNEYLYLLNLNQYGTTRAKISFPTGKEAIDIFSGERFKSGDVVELPPAGARLFSFLPIADKIEIVLPPQFIAGEPAFLIVILHKSGKSLLGLNPLRITVLNEKGEMEREWSKSYIAKNGVLSLSLSLPLNAKEGIWKILVEDLVSHKAAVKEVKLIPPVLLDVEEIKKGDKKEFKIRIKNNTLRLTKGKLLLLCDESLKTSLSPEREGEEIILKPREEKALTVYVSAEDDFAMGPQVLTFAMRMEGNGVISKKVFSVFSKEEKE
jgi:hypothetical protein